MNSMSPSNNSHWRSLSPFPGETVKYNCKLMKVDCSHFIAISDNPILLFTFDRNGNNWNVKHHAMLRNLDSNHDNAVMIQSLNTFFISKRNGTIQIFHIQTKELNEFDDKSRLMLAKIICVDGQFHVINGIPSSVHQIWNHDTHKGDVSIHYLNTLLCTALNGRKQGLSINTYI